MEVNTIACDVCGDQKRETNHWLVALERAGLEGIIYQPLEALSDPPPDNCTVRHICGSSCAHTDLSRYLDSLTEIEYPTKGEAE